MIKGQQIIDSHVHIGITDSFYMPEPMVLSSMHTYGIDRCIISNIEGLKKQTGEGLQQSVNEAAIRFARRNPGKIAVLLWARPEEEGRTPEFETMLASNRDVVCGIKVHPAASGVKISDRRVGAYAALGAQYGVPVLFHTADDVFSQPGDLLPIARKYPEGNFILGHMGLRTDHDESIRLILEEPNLYGDTAWVRPADALRVIAQGGEDKLLFGTDSPINGADTYNDPVYYQAYFKEFPDLLSETAYDKLMYKNAERLFRPDVLPERRQE